MSFPPDHDEDFHLAQECLEGKPSALRHLQDTLREPLLAFLQSCGGNADEAGEIVAELWTDCVTPGNRRRPKLASYDGKCTLKTFLSGVTLNVLLTRRRKEKRHGERVLSALDGEGVAGDGADAADPGLADEHAEGQLLRLMRAAVETAFMSCPAEEFVLLKLRYLAGVHPPELAKMFGCSRSTIDRVTKEAERGLEKAVLRSIKARDPWLELQWPDFVELCRKASPACFAME